MAAGAGIVLFAGLVVRVVKRRKEMAQVGVAPIVLNPAPIVPKPVAVAAAPASAASTAEPAGSRPMSAVRTNAVTPIDAPAEDTGSVDDVVVHS